MRAGAVGRGGGIWAGCSGQQPGVAELLRRGIPGRAHGSLFPGSWRTGPRGAVDRKSTRLNSSHLVISYAVFCLKKKKKEKNKLYEYKIKKKKCQTLNIKEYK